MPENQIDRRVYKVEYDLHLIKEALAENNRKHELIISSINEIKMTMQAQRGFISGLKSVGAASIAFGTFVIGVIAFFIDHIFGKP